MVQWPPLWPTRSPSRLRKPSERDSFGKGNIVGVIAPESANNAKEGGALVPTLAFGIPGSAEMAVFLSVLILHGMVPGPTIMTESLDIIWILIAAAAAVGCDRVYHHDFGGELNRQVDVRRLQNACSDRVVLRNDRVLFA